MNNMYQHQELEQTLNHSKLTKVLSTYKEVKLRHKCKEFRFEKRKETKALSSITYE
jgi:hypothetical protein